MNAARAFAGGFGLGRLPAPGTAASLAAAACGAGLLRRAGRPALLAAALLSLPAGHAAIARLPEADQDPGWIVADELSGQLLAMLWMRRPSLGGTLASFALFRALDIAKPGPIGRADRMGGPAGVMLDDVVAGLAVSALLGLATALLRTRPHAA